jgi:hypothetical protein
MMKLRFSVNSASSRAVPRDLRFASTCEDCVNQYGLIQKPVRDFYQKNIVRLLIEDIREQAF